MYASPSKQEYGGHFYAQLRYHTRHDRQITQVLRKLYFKKIESNRDGDQSEIIDPSNVNEDVTINGVNYIYEVV